MWQVYKEMEFSHFAISPKPNFTERNFTEFLIHKYHIKPLTIILFQFDAENICFLNLYEKLPKPTSTGQKYM